MPSPFPGMDPWLESPCIWPDFHMKFACVLSAFLNKSLPTPFYARLHSRMERHESNSEPIEHPMVEVRDPSQGHQLVTLIEIVSPANKSTGSDRDAYFKKQAEVLASEASLVEVDLLRGGKRLFAAPELASRMARHPTRVDYVALVNRAWKREAYQVFPMTITEPLKKVPLPLRQGQPEPILDLQEFFRLAYAGGPYARGAVDYAKPPHPPLPTELAPWAEECLRTFKS